jgi:hypothetical protein
LYFSPEASQNIQGSKLPHHFLKNELIELGQISFYTNTLLVLSALTNFESF